MFMASLFTSIEFVGTVLMAVVAFAFLSLLRPSIVLYLAVCYNDDIDKAHLHIEEMANLVHKRANQIVYIAWFIVTVSFSVLLHLNPR